MSDKPTSVSPDGHLDLAVGLLLDQIATMQILGLLKLSTAENVVASYISDQRLSPMTRSQAVALRNDIKKARQKRRGGM